MKNWNDLKTFFAALDKTDYVILRNFETLSDEFLNESHPDIDLLCSDRDMFLGLTGSVSRTDDPHDKIHRKVLINGKETALDVRCVGDGYYDSSWEADILKNRVPACHMFYIPDEVNYYYSLLYHVLIQKNSVSEDYKTRLTDMAAKIDDQPEDPLSIRTLEKFMKSRNYCYTYPEYSGAVLNLENADKTMVRTDPYRKFKRDLRHFREIIRAAIPGEKKHG